VARLKENQQKRFKDVKLVDDVVGADTEWRKLRFDADNWNRLKNLCSKQIGDKMKKKEPAGGDELPEEFMANISAMTADAAEKLTINQLKKVTTVIDEKITETDMQRADAEKKRNEALQEIGNLLHETCVISDNEDENGIERLWGKDVGVSHKKYSHVDLLHMIDGVDCERGAGVSGSRGYFLKGPAVFLKEALVQLGFIRCF